MVKVTNDSKSLKDRMKSGELENQKCWSFIKDMNSSEERLDSVAIRDGYRTYTYRQMFRSWENYAEAFTAIDITEKNKSRAMLVVSPLAESIFALYGLNMTGASVSLLFEFDLYDDENIRNMIKKEWITDLIISELYAFPKIVNKLLRDKEQLGLRNIIILESPMGGDYGVPAFEVVRKMNAFTLKKGSECLMMSDLLKRYEATPISYGSKGSSDYSMIMHTTGTSSGIHKPVPMSDRAINSFVIRAVEAKETNEDLKSAPEHMVSSLMMTMAWVYATVDTLHTSLSLGMEIVCIPLGAFNPRYAEAIEDYGVSILFSNRMMVDAWQKTNPNMDLSKLKIIFLGGSYVSPEFKKGFNKFLKQCGSTAKVINGYGLSELGGACIVAGSDRMDDAIGYPMPGVKVKIHPEDSKKFYDLSDGPRTGILYVSSPSLCSGYLGDIEFTELEKIDDLDYFNTNDLVRVNDDGSITCIGRSNKFFVNNAGVRFDASLVETAVAAQPGILACGLAAEFNKSLHDNVPVLYVETKGGKAEELVILRKALIQVFINDGLLSETNLPSQCVLTEKLPLNSGGKVDSKRLATGTVKGRRFHIKPVRLNGHTTDIVLVPAPEVMVDLQGTGVPEELEKNPYSIYAELMGALPEINAGHFEKLYDIPGLREMFLRFMDFDIKDIPWSIHKLAPTLIEMIFEEFPMKLLKGDDYMKNMINSVGGFAPMFGRKNFPLPLLPPMPFMPGFAPWGMYGKKDSEENDHKEDWEDFKSNVKTLCEQLEDMQKSSVEATKEQWDIFFDYTSKMQESLIDALPDEAPAGNPFFPPLPSKDYLKKRKEARDEANEHAKEQVDSFLDYAQKRQDKVKEAVSEGVKDVEDKVEKKKASKKTESKKVASKKSARKEAPAKKTEPKKTASKEAAPAEKKAPAKKAPAKKSPAKKAAKPVKEKKEPIVEVPGTADVQVTEEKPSDAEVSPNETL